MEKQINRFFADLSQRQFSPHTIQSYRHDLKDFIGFLGSLPVDDFNEVTVHHVHSFADRLRTEGQSDATIYRKSCSIRSFFRFLKRNQPGIEDPTRHLHRPKISRDRPDYLTHESFRGLIDYMDLDSYSGQRDRMILEVLYGTGIKIGELIALEIGDIDLDSRNLSVSGRQIPINHTMCALLSAYRDRVRPYFDKNQCPRFFLNYKGYQLTRQAIWKNIKRYSEDAGLEQTLSSHMLRNSYAVNRLNAGATLEEIQQEMGYQKRHSTRFFLQAMEVE